MTALRPCLRHPRGHLAEGWGGAGPAEPPNSIPGGCSGAEGAQGLRIRLWEALGSPCQGSLGCSSPPCVDGLSPAHPGGCGEAGSETPTPCPRVPPDGVMGWEAGAGAAGEMGCRRNGQPLGAPRGRRQCLHVLLAGSATGDFAFLVQEIDDGAQHGHQQDADDDGHDDHPFALRGLPIWARHGELTAPPTLAPSIQPLLSGAGSQKPRQSGGGGAARGLGAHPAA